jgi:hypothetical protein
MRRDEFRRGGECESGRLREDSVEGDGERAPGTGFGDDIVVGMEDPMHCTAVLWCRRMLLLLAMWQCGGIELRKHVQSGLGATSPACDTARLDRRHSGCCLR